MSSRPRKKPRPRKAAASPLGAAGQFYRQHIKPRLTRRLLKWVIIVGIIIAIALPVATYAFYARDIADRDRLMNRNNTGIILKDRYGSAFYSSGVRSTKDDVPLSKISDYVEQAAIASEDKDFYHHHGFSFRGTARAFINNVIRRDATASGGSTITQQLVKNKLLGSQKNYLRKYQEVAMAVAVERRYTKDEILEMYLNSAYFGDGAFGINDAAHTYFAKDASQLSLAESSLLIGLLPAPSYYSPITGTPERAKETQRNVLRKMVATGKISSQQRDEALHATLSYSNDASKGGSEYAQHFANMIIKELEDKYGEERVKRSGFTVMTTLDLTKQKPAEQIIRDQVAITAPRGGRNAGLVSIDPKNGQVLALVGSVDYYNKTFGQVNMATALRQPGSSFKPIYYSDAIERELITAATILDDKRTTFGGSYTPSNFDGRYKGKMSVRKALAESRNVPAVEVMQKETVSKAVDAAQRLGITTVNDPNKYGLSLALGTAEVRLLEMVSAYGAFAQQGQHYKPIMYTKVVDKFGTTITNTKKPRPQKVLSPESAYIMASILSDTAARAPTYGTSLNISGQTVALKTGTTNDNRDAWTIGFTPSIVTGVWLGNNENQPMRGLAGGSGAGAIWKKTMTEYLAHQPREEFPRPAGIAVVAICSGTELRAVNSGSNTFTEYFKRGSEPTKTCNTAEPPKEKDKKDEKEQQQTDTNNGNQDNSGQGNGEGSGNDNGSTTPPPPPSDDGGTTPTDPGGGGRGGDEPGTPPPPTGG